MFWQSVSFTPPAGVNGVAGGMATALATVESTMANGAGQLAGLGLASPPPAGNSPADLREDASAMLASPCPYIAVTPYQHGVGQRRGDRAYLTPANAIQAVANRMGGAQQLLDDAAGLPGLPIDNALALVVMAGVDEGGLASSLGSFNRVFPLTELQQAERRASGLASLERDKFRIPPAPGYPAWGQCAPQRGGPGLATSRALGGQLALAEGMNAAGQSPAQRLGAFASKRQATMQAQQQALQQVQAQLTGSNPGWLGVYLEGLASTLVPLLAQFVPPLDVAFKCCAAVCWYGRKEQVAYYREAFGLRNPLEAML